MKRKRMPLVGKQENKNILIATDESSPVWKEPNFPSVSL